ncbi:MAG: site-specific DNA-methyltransferase, partial [Deltaproteobacteria bacterium]|nr:site-specific DNA-methyltransferase [Deltaproteobacteria bacterium]
MKLKQAILTIMDRDTLKAVVDDLEIESVDRRNAEEMRVRVSRNRQAEPEMLMAHLSEKQVKAVCEQMDVSPRGRRKELMERLLNTTGTEKQMPEKLSIPGSVKTVKPNKKQAQKESPPMADKQNNGNQNEQQPAPVRLPDPPPGMMRVTRTELVWPGKYNEDGTLKEVPRVSLPFQVIETVNETRATREAKKGGIQPGLFDVYEGKEGDSFEEGWKNKLIWGDNLLVMGSLLEKFAGKFDLIYIDPPFATGADFTATGFLGDEAISVTKEQSIIEERAYRDTWGYGIRSYLDMMITRLKLIRELLSETGTLYLHCDYRTNHYQRVMLEEVFGVDHFISEIIWKRRSGIVKQTKTFGACTDTILMFSKSNEYLYNRQFTKVDSEKYVEQRFKYIDEKGRRYRLSNLVNPGYRPTLRYEYKGYPPPPNGWAISFERMKKFDEEGRLEFPKNNQGRIQRRQFLDEWEGYPVQNLWTDIYQINPVADERLDYPTQKPESLIERIIKTSTNDGALIGDFFAGSGSTVAKAEKLGRRWICCDISRFAIHVTRKRLLGIDNCKPFEVLNLGKYERQYWQGVTFGEKKEKHITEQALYEYLAFILKLYGAQPVAGLAHLHGKKRRAMVHIGAVDAPVTIAEIDAAVEECVQLKQPELHVLGWEWEMGLYDLMVEAAKKKGVKLLLLQIPREVMEQQAAAKGDVRFFELAYLEVEVQRPSPRPSPRGRGSELAVQVALKDFVIPNTELIPEEVRSKIKKWSDYIDYWAVDWDFQNDTFMQGWV